MINEIYQLYEGLSKNNIDIPDWHPWLIKPIKKGEGLLVKIDSECNISDIEYYSSEQMSKLWNIVESNQKSFPGMNFTGPVYKTNDNELISKYNELNKKGKNKPKKEILSLLKDVVQEDKIALKPKDKKSFWGRIFTFPNEEIKFDKENSFKKLIDCFQNKEKKNDKNKNIINEEFIDEFVVNFVNKLIELFEHGEIENNHLNILQDIIIGKWDKKEKNFKETKTTIYFDLDKYEKSETRITSFKMKKCINDFLNNKTINANENELKSVCSITGKKTAIESKKFPEPNLPVVGQSYIFAMNKAASCQKRYNKESAAICPMGKNILQTLSNSLEYITKDKRKYKNWIPVINGKWDNKNPKRDLLIAYLKESPISEISNALLLGGSNNEGNFETISSTVCDAFKNKESNLQSAFLNVFALRSVSKGETQVVLNKSYKVEEIFHAVEIWKKAAKNIPNFSLFLSLKKGEKAKKHEPFIPFTSEIISLLQHKWIKNGESNNKIEGCKLNEVFDLFFQQENKINFLNSKILHLIIQRITPLLLGIKSRIEINNWKEFDNNFEKRKTALLAVSILGILLYKQNITKENYMKSVAYNIGRLLSLADSLHKQYCIIVRDKSIPGQLIGNAIMPTAMVNPEKGLVRLGERICIYKAWAEKATGENIGLAKWILGKLGEVSEIIANSEIPQKTNDSIKAQILLGYLAKENKENQ